MISLFYVSESNMYKNPRLMDCSPTKRDTEKRSKSFSLPKEVHRAERIKSDECSQYKCTYQDLANEISDKVSKEEQKSQIRDHFLKVLGLKEEDLSQEMALTLATCVQFAHCKVIRSGTIMTETVYIHRSLQNFAKDLLEERIAAQEEEKKNEEGGKTDEKEEKKAKKDQKIAKKGMTKTKKECSEDECSEEDSSEEVVKNMTEEAKEKVRDAFGTYLPSGFYWSLQPTWHILRGSKVKTEEQIQLESQIEIKEMLQKEKKLKRNTMHKTLKEIKEENGVEEKMEVDQHEQESSDKEELANERLQKRIKVVKDNEAPAPDTVADHSVEDHSFLGLCDGMKDARITDLSREQVSKLKEDKAIKALGNNNKTKDQLSEFVDSNALSEKVPKDSAEEQLRGNLQISEADLLSMLNKLPTNQVIKLAHQIELSVSMKTLNRVGDLKKAIIKNASKDEKNIQAYAKLASDIIQSNQDVTNFLQSIENNRNYLFEIHGKLGISSGSKTNTTKLIKSIQNFMLEKEMTLHDLTELHFNQDLNEIISEMVIPTKVEEKKLKISVDTPIPKSQDQTVEMEMEDVFDNYESNNYDRKLKQLMPDFSEIKLFAEDEIVTVVQEALQTLGNLQVKAIANQIEFEYDQGSFQQELVKIALNDINVWEMIKNGSKDKLTVYPEVAKMRLSDAKNFAYFCGVPFETDGEFTTATLSRNLQSKFPNPKRLQLIFDYWKSADFYLESKFHFNKQIQPYFWQSENEFNFGANYFYLNAALDNLTIEHLGKVREYLKISVPKSIKTRTYELKEAIIKEVDTKTDANEFKMKVSKFIIDLQIFKEQEKNKLDRMKRSDLDQLASEYGMKNSSNIRPVRLKEKILSEMIKNVDFPEDKAFQEMSKDVNSYFDSTTKPSLPCGMSLSNNCLTLEIKLFCLTDRIWLNVSELEKVMNLLKMSTENGQWRIDNNLQSKLTSAIKDCHVRDGYFNINSDMIDYISQLTSNREHIKKLSEYLLIIQEHILASHFKRSEVGSASILDYAFDGKNVCPIFMHSLETLYVQNKYLGKKFPRKMYEHHLWKLSMIHLGACNLTSHQRNNVCPSDLSRKSKILEIMFREYIQQGCDDMIDQFFPSMNIHEDKSKMLEIMLNHAFDPTKSFYSVDDVIWYTFSRSLLQLPPICTEVKKLEFDNLKKVVNFFGIPATRPFDRKSFEKSILTFIEHCPPNQIMIRLFVCAIKQALTLSIDDWKMISYEIINLKPSVFDFLV